MCPCVCVHVCASLDAQSRGAKAGYFCCDDPLMLLCIYNVSFTHISLLIKYSFEGRLPTLSRLHLLSSLHHPFTPSFLYLSMSVLLVSAENMDKRKTAFSQWYTIPWGHVTLFFVFYWILSSKQPVPAHLCVSTSTVYVSVCTFIVTMAPNCV